MYVILVYDISLDDNGAKIWRKVYKLCKKYLVHVQNSVFEGEVTKSQLFELKRKLKNILREDLDSLIIFSSRHERWLEKEIIGNTIDSTDNFI